MEQNTRNELSSCCCSHASDWGALWEGWAVFKAASADLWPCQYLYVCASIMTCRVCGHRGGLWSLQILPLYLDVRRKHPGATAPWYPFVQVFGPRPMSRGQFQQLQSRVSPLVKMSKPVLWKYICVSLRGTVSNPPKHHSHMFSTRGPCLRGPGFISWSRGPVPW